jgi:wyosine [tRNA(Phe)-imidazoG37] synthetase (radical SAM superfamily)
VKYIFGAVPSRRLGKSLGVSPIPKKTCNYSCVYCQLGRTNHMTNKRQLFFKLNEIIDEFDEVLKNNIEFDVVTVVGEGEPTLYLKLGELIFEIKKKTDKPVAVITNGSLLYDADLRSELCQADIVLPTFDAYDDESFKKINRSHGSIDFNKIKEGLKLFSEEFKGQLWLELMLMDGVNDDDESLSKYSEALKEFRYDRLYINTPVRPPAESYIKAVNHDKMDHAVNILGGISIDLLASQGFHSEIKDDYEAILSIIKRHPMNQFEIEGFLKARGNKKHNELLNLLKSDNSVTIINYKGYDTYRLK